MVDPIEIGKQVEARTFGDFTDFRLPTGLLWVLVMVGIGALTVNAYLVQEQLKLHAKLIDGNTKEIAEHESHPAHNDSARFLLNLDQRIRELEAVVPKERK